MKLNLENYRFVFLKYAQNNNLFEYVLAVNYESVTLYIVQIRMPISM